MVSEQNEPPFDANRGRAHPVPPMNQGPPKNLKDIPILPAAGYGVFEWCPHEDGKGKPEAVVIDLEMGAEFDGLHICLRLKSRAEVNRLLIVLERHRDNVWPLPAGG